MTAPADDARQELLGRIIARRASIEDFLRLARPRGNRLVNTAIVSSALAAVLTAGPALGGETFSDGVASGLSLSSDSLVWRTLCLLALVVSLVAAISTNLSKSHDTAQRIAAAETVNAELEGLQALVAFGQIPLADAVKLYQQYVTKIPWVKDQHPQSPPAWSSPPQQNGQARPAQYLGQAGAWGPPGQQQGWGPPGPPPRRQWSGPQPGDYPQDRGYPPGDGAQDTRDRR
jgi:hypothetical protein